MLVIRPVQASDLDALSALTELTTFGLTTLPRDLKLLEKRIRKSEQSFANIDLGEPEGQAYLLVMEDTESRTVVGTSGIVSKVGGFEPFYAYRIEISVHESIMLNVRKEISVLHLVAEHNGPSEIGSLFLHPDCRKEGNGRLLSLSRFLMMAEFPHLFDRQVIAEMRGVISDEGRSPFWDAIGTHFFDLEFPKADYLSILNKEFIGDLMPKFPIYTPLLPADAQAVIGEVHENTRPARHLLECEGFRFDQMIDIFEAGPILHCSLDMIRAVRESRVAEVKELVDQVESDSRWLISNASKDFRAAQGSLDERDGGVILPRETAAALNVQPGDSVRFVSPKAT
jgi:arginine N-succinyltransferase